MACQTGLFSISIDFPLIDNSVSYKLVSFAGYILLQDISLVIWQHIQYTNRDVYGKPQNDRLIHLTLIERRREGAVIKQNGTSSPWSISSDLRDSCGTIRRHTQRAP